MTTSRPRGRPRKDGTPVGSPRPHKAHKEGQARDAKIVDTVRLATAGEAVAVLAARADDLRFLERAAQITWLTQVVAGDVTETRTQFTKEGDQVETVQPFPAAVRVKAMELVMRATGSLAHEATRVSVGVSTAAAPKVERKIVLYLPPGKGPQPG